MLQIFFLCLFLFSCGNNPQDGERKEMMKQESYCESMMGEEMHKAIKSRCIGPEMIEDEDTSVIRSMLVNHGQIDRRVKNPKNGVKT